ncbi:hypothetical protein [Kitasatospora sp. NPDC093558]|uniref:hypothetical protein n=1 Tax=Kitasatospora sp. NPDC093558 TaxID=3155201 RepID=UPI00343C261D
MAAVLAAAPLLTLAPATPAHAQEFPCSLEVGKPTTTNAVTSISASVFCPTTQSIHLSLQGCDESDTPKVFSDITTTVEGNTTLNHQVAVPSPITTNCATLVFPGLGGETVCAG